MEPKVLILKILKVVLYILFVMFVINVIGFLFDLSNVVIAGGRIDSFEYGNFKFMLNDIEGYNQFSGKHLFLNIIIFFTVLVYIFKTKTPQAQTN